MVYQENEVLLTKIKGWINSSLTRATSQQQELYFSVQEFVNPFYSDPWNFGKISKVILLPDGYIMPTFPKDDVYSPILDRDPRARELTTAVINYLTEKNVPVDISETTLQLELYRFFQWLFTWNTELIWVDKVHPEDWVANVLFDSPAPTYSNRSLLIAGGDPDSFLRGSSYYVVRTWLDNLPVYDTLDSTEFVRDGERFSLYYPGAGIAYGKSKGAFEKHSLAQSIAMSIFGALAKGLSSDQLPTLTSQYWRSRLAALADTAVYCNPYVSYLIRNNF